MECFAQIARAAEGLSVYARGDRTSDNPPQSPNAMMAKHCIDCTHPSICDWPIVPSSARSGDAKAAPFVACSGKMMQSIGTESEVLPGTKPGDRIDAP